MKKIALIICISLLVIACNSNEQTSIAFSKLPTKSQELLQTHFSDKNISVIYKERENFGNEYEVIFTDGSKIEFNNHGDWKEIKEKTNGVPNNLIPENINSFINQNHSSNFIATIEKDKKGYDVALNNGVELKFNLNGNFLRYDD